jgi:hypothetical protein
MSFTNGVPIMFNSRIVALALAVCSAALLPVHAKADTLTYNFTYSGTGTYTPSETATGSGSITFNFSALGAGGLSDITAFSFTDTLVTPSNGSSSFTYGLPNLHSSSEVFGGTLANPILTNIQLQTNYLAGSNNAFGNVDFNLIYSGPTSDSTGSLSTSFLPDFTNGGGTMTLAPAATTPEPSSILLLATGLAGAGLLYASRKRFA